MKGQRVLAEADDVVHDRLVAPEILDMAPRAVRHNVGKGPREGTPQHEIDALLVRLAGDGRTVVRLQGGDPTVFGQLASELAALAGAGVPFEIVPGVTSVTACAAAAGIPLTQRELSGGFAVVTASRSPESGDQDWPALARIPTLVVLMGVRQIGHFVPALLAAGLDPARPVAIVENGTTGRQRILCSTLEALEHDVREAELTPPAIFFIGEVARTPERFAGNAPRKVRGPYSGSSQMVEDGTL